MTRTSKGTPLTDEMLDRLADDAETGYPPEQLRVRKGRGRPRLSDGDGPSGSVNVRLDDELRDRLDQRAARESTSASEVVREALRRHLVG